MLLISIWAKLNKVLEHTSTDYGYLPVQAKEDLAIECTVNAYMQDMLRPSDDIIVLAYLCFFKLPLHDHHLRRFTKSS